MAEEENLDLTWSEPPQPHGGKREVNDEVKEFCYSLVPVPLRRPKAHGGGEVNGPKVAEFLDR